MTLTFLCNLVSLGNNSSVNRHFHFLYNATYRLCPQYFPHGRPQQW